MNRQERKREGRGNNKFLTIVNEKTNNQPNKQERRIKERGGTNKQTNEGRRERNERREKSMLQCITCMTFLF